MTNLTATKKTGKTKSKKSDFQKMWDKADRLQRQNAQLKDRLDGLIESSEQKIRPVEREAAEANLPLLRKLLSMGQRKSLAKWERQILDGWVKELITAMHTFNLSDSQLMDDIARYDAFRMGVALDDSDEDSASPYEQMTLHVQNLQREAEAAAEQERSNEKAQTEAELNDLNARVDELVESILDEQLGPPPAVDEKHSHTFDLLQDQLDAELEKRQQEYQEKRNALRDELMAELSKDMRDEFGFSPFDNDTMDSNDDPFANPDFDFNTDFNANYEGANSPAAASAPKIDNQTFHKMFRATAAKLHPDREPDSARRLEKQQLMAELLNARKKGDLLTVFKMYQQHTDNRESFSRDDEKQLALALNQYIDQLEQEKQEIICQSPMHFTVYHRFYNASKKKQDQEIDRHLEKIRANIDITEHVAGAIKSLKTLKPWLEDRYDQLRMSAFDNFVDDMDWDDSID